MAARGPIVIPWAIIITFVVTVAVTTPVDSWSQNYRFPHKIRSSDADGVRSGVGGISAASRTAPGDWEVAAGQARREILCPKKGFAFALGMRSYFSTLSGSVKATNRGGEGTFLNLHGHFRLPVDRTMWEFYSNLRVWDKVAIRVEYLPWSWAGPGHIPTDGNFAGLLLKKDDSINTDLTISTLLLGADYDVSFGRNLIFGPNADLYVIKWGQQVVKDTGESGDFSQMILEPAIGAHIRYDPPNTGYFSWFKPHLEARFGWMSLGGLGLSTWDMAAGISPPINRNVDAGIKLGYKQWKLDGSRGRLFTDVAVEGPYLDFALQF